MRLGLGNIILKIDILFKSIDIFSNILINIYKTLSKKGNIKVIRLNGNIIKLTIGT